MGVDGNTGEIIKAAKEAKRVLKNCLKVNDAAMLVLPGDYQSPSILRIDIKASIAELKEAGI